MRTSLGWGQLTLAGMCPKQGYCFQKVEKRNPFTEIVPEVSGELERAIFTVHHGASPELHGTRRVGSMFALQCNRYNRDAIETDRSGATGVKEAKTSHIKENV